jgi:hypothetical protein
MWQLFVTTAAMFISVPHGQWVPWSNPGLLDCVTGDYTSVRMTTSNYSEVLWGDTAGWQPNGTGFAYGFLDIEIFSLIDNINYLHVVTVNGRQVNTGEIPVNTPAVYSFNTSLFPHNVSVQLRGGDVRSYLLCISFRGYFTDPSSSTTGISPSPQTTGQQQATTGISLSQTTGQQRATTAPVTTTGIPPSQTTAGGLQPQTTGSSVTTTLPEDASESSVSVSAVIFAWLTAGLVIFLACSLPVIGVYSARHSPTPSAVLVHVSGHGTISRSGHQGHIRTYTMAPTRSIHQAMTLQHRHLAPCVGITPDDRAVFAVSPLASDRSPILNVDEWMGQVLTYCHQVGLALQYLHEHDVVHGNVCPPCVVYAPDGKSVVLVNYLNADPRDSVATDIHGLGWLVWTALNRGSVPGPPKKTAGAKGSFVAMLRSCTTREEAMRPRLEEVLQGLQTEIAQVIIDDNGQHAVFNP